MVYEVILIWRRSTGTEQHKIELAEMLLRAHSEPQYLETHIAVLLAYLRRDPKRAAELDIWRQYECINTLESLSVISTDPAEYNKTMRQYLSAYVEMLWDMRDQARRGVAMTRNDRAHKLMRYQSVLRLPPEIAAIRGVDSIQPVPRKKTKDALQHLADAVTSMGLMVTTLRDNVIRAMHKGNNKK